MANSQILLEKLVTFWTPVWMMFEDRGIKTETETFVFWFAEGMLTSGTPKMSFLKKSRWHDYRGKLSNLAGEASHFLDTCLDDV